MLISICWHLLLPDSSTTCRLRSLEPIRSCARAFIYINLIVNEKTGTDFSHIFDMFDEAIMRSGLYPFFYIALLNDFGSFSLCTRDMLFDSAQSSTASPSLSVEVYPQSVLWLLKSPITI